MSRTRQAQPPAAANPFTFYLWVAYLTLLLYGALFPLSNWEWHAGNLRQFLDIAWPRYISTPDVIVNLLVFIPVGLLSARLLQARTGTGAAIALATLSGAVLTFTIEYLQMFLPGRVTSLLDMLLNVGGTLMGAALVGIFHEDAALGRWTLNYRNQTFLAGRLIETGLMVLGLWTLSQLAPLVPSLDIGNLRHGIKPVWHVLSGEVALNIPKTIVYALNLAAIACILHTLLQRPSQSTRYFIAFAGAVLLLKIPVLSRQLSAEGVLGFAAGCAIAITLGSLPRRSVFTLAAIFLLAAFAVDELRPGETLTKPLRQFNWIPFRAHVSSLIGIADILASAWTFLGLAYLVISLRPAHKTGIAVFGGILLFAYTFGFEWMQQFIPDRSPDITDALLAVIAWTLPWLHPAIRENVPAPARGAALSPPPPPASRTSRLRHRRRRHRYWLPATILTGAGIAIVAGFTFFSEPLEQALDESVLHKLPAPEELPPVRLPLFKHTHPRLPAPSLADIAQLRRDNPGLIRKARKRADGGKGKFRDATLTAFIDPGSIDLDALHQRLMALEFRSRGHGQAKPLAVAYDWLYDQWSPAQRAQLQDKLAEGADYLIHRIRVKQRLSPYNVVLYNSPFQALVATTIALYGDDPRGDLPMRFTYDFWKHRVLPVWEQIMGQNGGWHEGGEYVGAGIGDAIYSVPAMWRKATGEDMFASVPGIGGFRNFLVYRMRPDNTHFRIGDAGFFDNASPDRYALALEFRDAAVYSLGRRCPRRPRPTSWPWGPLTDNALCNHDAIKNRPLSYLFDGVGILVARSDWSPEATYVTFKAGNHYWSHSHLDQGNFTIYHGGALAIDSGLYGTSYGSEHHMNYTHQTIAHNTITVTDPDDTVPVPRKKGPPETFANDGGQRRIGSGWGIESAPLELQEWLDKQDIYGAGRIVKYFDNDDFVVAVADIGAAYTSKLSGEGTFTHRTRRVESLWRSFAYDRRNGVIVVHDQVTASDPGFTKRWLLHTIEEPLITGNRFTAYISPGKGPAHLGGRLDGHVLLPRGAYISLVGGDGHEFFVDGKNYDEDGAVQKNARKKELTEPGAWRIEVSPAVAAREDEFLVVMTVSDSSTTPTHRVRLIEDSGRHGCEIIGPQRTTRFWFDDAHAGPLLEVTGGTGLQRQYDLRVAHDTAAP